MNNKELQEKMDLQKWLDSETNHLDMCGRYDYCHLCDKTDATPCANAFERLNAEKTVKTVKISAEDVTVSLGKKFDYDKVMQKKANRKSLTFAEKYELSDDVVKERYAILKDALTTTRRGDDKIKSRISKQCDTYRRNGEVLAKITIIGTSLRVNLPLDPYTAEYCDGKTPHVDTAHKKVYTEVPFQFKVNSKLALKRALALIETVKAL